MALPLELRTRIALSSPASYWALIRADRALGLFFTERTRTDEARARFVARDFFGAPLLPDGSLHGLWEREETIAPGEERAVWPLPKDEEKESVLNGSGTKWTMRTSCSYQEGLAEGSFLLRIKEPSLELSLRLSYVRGVLQGPFEEVYKLPRERRRTGAFFQGLRHGLFRLFLDGAELVRERFCFGKRMGRRWERMGSDTRNSSDYWLGLRHGFERHRSGHGDIRTFRTLGRMRSVQSVSARETHLTFLGKRRLWSWHFVLGEARKVVFSVGRREEIVLEKKGPEWTERRRNGSAGELELERKGCAVDMKKGGKFDTVRLGGLVLRIEKEAVRQ